MKFDNIEWKEERDVKSWFVHDESGHYRLIEYRNSPGRERIVIHDGQIVAKYWRVDPYLMGETVEELMQSGFVGTREDAEKMLKDPEYADPEWTREL